MGGGGATPAPGQRTPAGSAGNCRVKGCRREIFTPAAGSMRDNHGGGAMAVETTSDLMRERERTDVGLIGMWKMDEGYQVTEVLFRSDGRYQLDTRSTDPDLDYASTERGRYDTGGQTLTLAPYEYFGEPYQRRYRLAVAQQVLSLTTDYDTTQEYRLVPGSTADVLANEKVAANLVGNWVRNLAYAGTAEYTFRPGGYYVLKNTPGDSQLPPDFIRGRYEQDDRRLTLRPYSGVETQCELDFFGTTLTLIERGEYSGSEQAYELRAGSEADERAKAAEADAFLARKDWQVGTWQIQDAIHRVDLTFRPDGFYSAKEETPYLTGLVRGRYVLETRRIRLQPFVGQGIYARSNGEFGLVERTRELDYYDGELQFIDLQSLWQSVTLARKQPGTEVAVAKNVCVAQAERQRAGWHIGVWEVNDPTGWMEFTFRPDHRYMAKAGSNGVPSEVERGEYRLSADTVTLSPYAGLGPARAFELDLYDGDLFLVGDTRRMVVARKVGGSPSAVVEKTRHPQAMNGERGSILGQWTANLPGDSAALVFRPDGEFRLTHCRDHVRSDDYGIYSVDMAARTLVSDSRLMPAQTHGLDFYDDTMTIFGGTVGAPRSYTVNLGTVDAAIASSLAADAGEARVDATWLARVAIGPRDPQAVQMPTADIPADPHPARIFDAATVFTSFHLYRRFIPGFVYFNVQGYIRTVPVMNSREFYFFPTGRTLVRFSNYRAGISYPTTVADVTDSWGAYQVLPKPEQPDILHRYADNVLLIESDLGERLEMTLEDGRRNLFWGKDSQTLSEWAAEQTPIRCEGSATSEMHLMNTGVSLSTSIPPQENGDGSTLPATLPGGGV